MSEYRDAIAYAIHLRSILFLMIFTRQHIMCRMRLLSNAARWMAICLGALAVILVGWLLDITAFNPIAPSLPLIRPSATLALILSGAAVFTTSGIMVMWWSATSTYGAGRRSRLAKPTHDLYRHMYVHSDDTIVMMDPCGFYMEQNSQHERLLGYTSQELIGQTPALTL